MKSDDIVVKVFCWIKMYINWKNDILIIDLEFVIVIIEESYICIGCGFFECGNMVFDVWDFYI